MKPLEEAGAHAGLLVIGGAPRWQAVQLLPLGLDRRRPAGIVTPDDAGDEAAVCIEIGKLPRAPDQRIPDLPLEMAVRALDGTVLVGHAAIVARRCHLVMLAQEAVALGHVLGILLAEIAEPGRQAVGAVLLRGSAQLPQRRLQPLGQRREALAAEYHLGMAEAGPGQAEVIEHVVELLAGDGDAEFVHVGEVRQTDPAGLVALPEHHLLLGAVFCLPVADPPLQGAPDIRIEIRMAPPQLLEDADRAQTRLRLEHRHHLLAPYAGKRVRPSSAARRLLL